jgi:hypothetical protein
MAAKYTAAAALPPPSPSPPNNPAAPPPPSASNASAAGAEAAPPIGQEQTGWLLSVLLVELICVVKMCVVGFQCGAFGWAVISLVLPGFLSGMHFTPENTGQKDNA